LITQEQVANSHSSALRNQKNSPLLRLPGEIRNKIKAIWVYVRGLGRLTSIESKPGVIEHLDGLELVNMVKSSTHLMEFLLWDAPDLMPIMLESCMAKKVQFKGSWIIVPKSVEM
jgi:hypothetical protein